MNVIYVKILTINGLNNGYKQITWAKVTDFFIEMDNICTEFTFEL